MTTQKSAQEISKAIVHGDWINISEPVTPNNWIELEKRIIEALESFGNQRFEEALEEAMKIVGSDLLLTPDEFDSKNKLKVFYLLDRLAKEIRALIDKEK